MDIKAPKNKKILIIEDEATLVEVLTAKLSAEGFSVFKASDGKEGLETALKNHPDLILLDIVMPVMDGMTMLDRLRADEWGKSAKVILLTNLSDPEKARKSIAQGVREYLVKADWKLDDIVAKIDTELGLS